jgi:hypothetical protein
MPQPKNSRNAKIEKLLAELLLTTINAEASRLAAKNKRAG